MNAVRFVGIPSSYVYTLVFANAIAKPQRAE